MIHNEEFLHLSSLGFAAAKHFDNSGAETEHGLFLPAFGFRLQAKAGEIARKTAVFDTAGEYECHREAGMTGTLIVYRSSSPSD